MGAFSLIVVINLLNRMSDKDVIGLALTLCGSRGNELFYRNPKFMAREKKNTSNTRADELDSLCGSSSLKDRAGVNAPEDFTDFSSFDDDLVNHICVVKHNRGRTFHLEIDKVAFIGYPVQWDVTVMLHVVFATRANVSTNLKEQLSKLSQKVALIILQEAEILKDTTFDSILVNEEAAIRGNHESVLRSSVYSSPTCGLICHNSANDVCSPSDTLTPHHQQQQQQQQPSLVKHRNNYMNSGRKQKKCRRLVDFLDLLSGVEVGTSLCVSLPSGAPFSCHLHADPQKVQQHIDSLRPYHTLLLDPDLVKDAGRVPGGGRDADYSTVISGVIQATCCSKPLYQIAADADITLGHAMKVAMHLVYWDRAKIAYPICQSRVYALSRVLSRKELLFIKSAIVQNLLCPNNSPMLTELFNTFLSFCATTGGGQFELGVLFERLCLVSPDLQWIHLRNLVTSLLWCQYITQVHNFPLYKTYFTPPVHSNTQDSLWGSASGRVPFLESDGVDVAGVGREAYNSNDTETTSTLDSIDASCVPPSMQYTGVRSVLYSLDGSVHVDALAYRLNRSIVSLQGELRRLEQSGEILCCYRIEESRENNHQHNNNHNTYAQT